MASITDRIPNPDSNPEGFRKLRESTLRFGARTLVAIGLIIVSKELLPHEPDSVVFNRDVYACASQLDYQSKVFLAKDYPIECDRFSDTYRDTSTVAAMDSLYDSEYPMPPKNIFVASELQGPADDQETTKINLLEGSSWVVLGVGMEGLLFMRRRLKEVDMLHKGIAAVERYANQPGNH